MSANDPGLGTFQDTTTVLNPGAGGDILDESLPYRKDGAQRKRERFVIGGDSDASMVLDLELVDGNWCLPSYDASLCSKLDRVIGLLEAQNRLLRRLAGMP